VVEDPTDAIIFAKETVQVLSACTDSTHLLSGHWAALHGTKQSAKVPCSRMPTLDDGNLSVTLFMSVLPLYSCMESCGCRCCREICDPLHLPCCSAWAWSASLRLSQHRQDASV
jgi:hypothetical protein